MIAAIVLCLAFPSQSHSQCKQFTEVEVMPLLEDYIISGRYNTIKLKEGEEILIFKTMSKGIDYRVIVKCVDSLATNLHFTVKDWEDNLIFDNKDQNFSSVWDYNSTKTQRVKINVEVPQTTENPPLREGCVSVLTGIKPDM